MEDEFQINEYETLPTEPLFKPEPPDLSDVATYSALRQGFNEASSAIMPSQLYEIGNLDSFNSLGKDTRISTTMQGPGRDAYTQLSDGTLVPRLDQYNTGLTAAQNEELLAQSQSTGEKWGRGVGKFLGKTGVNVIGGTIGVASGMIEAMRTQSLSALYDNDIGNYLEDLNKRMDSSYGIYRTQAERELNFGQSLGTAGFWAEDFLGGLSFLAGTIISEGAWAAATGGTSLAAKGILGTAGRIAFRAMTKKSYDDIVGMALKEGNKVIRGTAANATDNLTRAAVRVNNGMKSANMARFIATSSGYEASVEARAYLEESRANFINEILTNEGRMPTPEELASFSDNATDAANAIFGANTALVGFSNYAILGRLLLGRTTTGKLSNNYFKKNVLGLGFNRTTTNGVTKLAAVNPSKFQRALGKSYYVAQPAFTEGFVEEGGQAVFSKTGLDYVMAGFDDDSTNDNIGLIDSFLKGVKETYTTKEGLKEVGLGALIGIFGGAANTRGRFNQYSAQKGAIESQVNDINSYDAAGLINSMVTASTVSKASQAAMRAEEQGDMSGELNANTAAISMLTERHLQYQDLTELHKNFQVALDLADNDLLMQEMDMTEDEVLMWKQAKYKEFERTSARHAENLNVAKAMIGEVPIAGLDQLEGLEIETTRGKERLNVEGKLASAVAFSLTIGQQSGDLMLTLTDQIRQVVANDIQADPITDALEVGLVLDQFSRDDFVGYQTAKKSVDTAQRRVDQQRTRLVKAQNEAQLADPETAQARARAAEQAQTALIEAEAALSEAQERKDLAFAALNIEQFTEDIITQDMLDNQAENVAKLEQTIDNVSKRDPQKGSVLRELVRQYETASANNQAYQGTIRTLLDMNGRVNMLNGWASEIINKKKALNEDIAGYFTDAMNAYATAYSYESGVLGQTKYIEEVERRRLAQEQEEQAPVEEVDALQQEPDNINEEVAAQSAEDIKNTQTKDPRQTRGQSKPKEQFWKDQVNEIVQNNNFTRATYRDLTNIDNLQEVKPTQEDVDRYNELLGKIKDGKYPQAIVNRNYDKVKDAVAETGLTKEENAELKDLTKKLNDWQILSGFNNQESSIAQYLNLIHQSNQGVDKTETAIRTPIDDAIKVRSSQETKAAPAGATNMSMVQSPDLVVAKKTDKGYEISHLNPSSLARIFPGAEAIEVVTKKKTVPASEYTKDELDELKNKPGSKIKVTTGGQEATFVVGNRARMLVKTSELEGIIPDSNIKILSLEKSNFMPIYERKGERDYEPLQGDFNFESVLDSEIITLDTTAAYRLKPGSKLKMFVNLNDKFNARLLEQLNAGEISEQEFANQMHIYVSEKNPNQIVGSVKAIQPGSQKADEALSKIAYLRTTTSREVLRAAREGKSMLELTSTVETQDAFMGTPKINVVESTDGNLQVEYLGFNERSIQEVTDYGYIQDEVVTTKSGTEYDRNTANFAREASRRNRGKKVPVVVFKVGNRDVVFPVNLIPSASIKQSQLDGILANSALSNAQKLFDINELARTNGIDPNDYAIVDLEQEESRSELSRLRTALGEKPEVADVDNWLESSHRKQDLMMQAEIAIDITDNPFSAGKTRLDLNTIEFKDAVELENDAIDRLDQLAKVVEINFQQNEPFSETGDNTKFFEIFTGENFVDLEASTYLLKRKNANILRAAFAEKIPNVVVESLGQDVIDQIKTEIAEFEFLNTGLKSNIGKAGKEINTQIETLEREEC